MQKKRQILPLPKLKRVQKQMEDIEGKIFVAQQAVEKFRRTNKTTVESVLFANEELQDVDGRLFMAQKDVEWIIGAMREEHGWNEESRGFTKYDKK